LPWCHSCECEPEGNGYSTACCEGIDVNLSGGGRTRELEDAPRRIDVDATSDPTPTFGAGEGDDTAAGGEGSTGKGVGAVCCEGEWSGNSLRGDADCSTGVAAVPAPSVKALKPANMSSKSSL